MTYTEAEKQVSENKNLIGKPLMDYPIEHLIISPADKLSDVVSAYYEYNYDNKKALNELGLLDEDLSIFLFPNRHAIGFFSTLEAYLEDNK